MTRLIGVLFLIACALCVGIVDQAVENGSVLIAGMFTFYSIITAIAGMIFVKKGI